MSENLNLIEDLNSDVVADEMRRTPKLFDRISPIAPVVELNSMGRSNFVKKVYSYLCLAEDTTPAPSLARVA